MNTDRRHDIRSICLLFLLAFAFWRSAPLASQTTGRIEGTVVDRDRWPLSGASVTATGPRLPGEQVAATDARGRFRLLALPPGEYRVVAELEGFQTAAQEGVRVPLDGAVVLQLDLVPAFADEITVTETPPLIDATSTASGAEFPRRLLEALPVPRSSGSAVPGAGGEGIAALATLAPGVFEAGNGVVRGPSMGGATSTENRYLIDGVDITDSLRGSAGDTVLPFELVQEVEVKTGGYGVELGGALAGVLNVVTRSGGNELEGELFGYYSDQRLQADQGPLGSGFTEYDVGVSAGGPLARDRLWYFAAINPQQVEVDKRTLQDFEVTDLRRSPRYAAKLTWQATAGHRLTLSSFGVLEGRQENFNARAAGLVGGSGPWRTYTTAVNWLGSYGPDLLSQLSVGRSFSLWGGSRPLADVPLYSDRTGGVWAAGVGCGDPEPLADQSLVYFAPGCRGGFAITEIDGTRRDQGRLGITWFHGRHELRVGGELRRAQHDFRGRMTGPWAGPIVDEAGVAVLPEGLPGAMFLLRPGFYVLQTSVTSSHSRADESGLFAEWRWQPVPSISLTVGVRADALHDTGAASAGGAHELDFGWEEMVAPRLGLVWDVSGAGRSRLYAHAGRYYESVPLILAALGFNTSSDRYFVFAYPANGSLPTYDNPGTLLADFSSISEPQLVLPGTRPTHTDEVLLGVEHEVGGGVAIGVRGVYREIGDVMEDFLVGSGFVLGNPGGTYAVDPATGEPLDAPVTYPEPVRRHRALELTVRRRLARRWQTFGSYVYSRTEGNYEGLGPAAHWTGAFDRWELLRGGDGPLPTDRRHQVKLYGSWSSATGFVAGVAARYLSGIPINKFGGFENLWLSRFVVPRGTAGRTPAVWSLDLHLGYPVLRGLRGPELELLCDVSNVTDEQAVTAVDQVWTFANGEGPDPDECGGPGTGPGTACPEGNPSWGSALALQPGRVVRLGLKMRW